MMVMTKNNDTQVIIVFVVLFLVSFLGLEKAESNPGRMHSYNELTLNYTDNSVDFVIPKNSSNNKQQNKVIILCPGNISTYTDINSCSSYISDGLNVQYQENSITRLSWEMTGSTTDASKTTGINQINEYNFNEGITTVTYTAEDYSSNIITCSFTVTIIDNQVPRLINIPSDITVVSTPGECSAHVYWQKPRASDNCSPDGYSGSFCATDFGMVCAIDFGSNCATG